METKLIDLDVAVERLGGDREFLFELLNEMVGQLDETIENLETAISASEYTDVRSIAHGMKGAASNLGADRITDYFKELEDKGASENLDGAEVLIEKIRTTHKDMVEFLNTQ
jgi:HPt (histidine-containing phosphotransfer) domain-containing protein